MLEQELILDRYRVIGKAGSGGYATVQHAFDTHLKRDVAIKCIRITRADVDAAKRTAALLRQIDRPPEVSIPIGSSRVIPVGGSAAARIHRESTRSVYRRHRSGQPAFGSVEGVRANVLPQEPGFLSKREERLRRGKDRKSNRGTAFDPLPDRTQDIPAEVPPEEEIIEEPRISRPREIPSLVDMLPGAISGAGETKISGVDSDALSINLDLEELLSRTKDVDRRPPHPNRIQGRVPRKRSPSWMPWMRKSERVGKARAMLARMISTIATSPWVGFARRRLSERPLLASRRLLSGKPARSINSAESKPSEVVTSVVRICLRHLLRPARHSVRLNWRSWIPFLDWRRRALPPI